MLSQGPDESDAASGAIQNIYLTKSKNLMPKKLILHIGGHKTGSTSIQTYLAENELHLNKHGYKFVYLDNQINLSSCIGWGQKDGAPFFYIADKQYIKLLDMLRGQPGNVILSCEDLFFLTQSIEIEKFVDGVSAFFDEISVIVYLRRQDSMAISNKAQGAKSGQSGIVFGHSNHPLPELSSAVLDYLDYLPKLDLWSSHPRINNFVVRIYDRATLVRGDVVADFLSQVGLPLNSHKVLANKSLSVAQTLFFHHLWRLGLPGDVIWQLVLAGIIPDGQKCINKPSRGGGLRFYNQFTHNNKLLLMKYGEGQQFSEDFSMYPEHEVLGQLSEEYIDACYKQIILFSMRGAASRGPSVELLRDSALLWEKNQNLANARELMELAAVRRPEGPIIKNKLKEYRKTLSE